MWSYLNLVVSIPLCTYNNYDINNLQPLFVCCVKTAQFNKKSVELYFHPLILKAGCSNDDGVSAEAAASCKMVLNLQFP